MKEGLPKHPSSERDPNKQEPAGTRMTRRGFLGGFGGTVASATMNGAGPAGLIYARYVEQKREKGMSKFFFDEVDTYEKLLLREDSEKSLLK